LIISEFGWSYGSTGKIELVVVRGFIMLAMVILFFIILYTLIAYVVVRRVRRITTDRRLRALAVTIAVLIPSWDVVLSGVIYYISCPFFPKASIYETAKTDGIFYEGPFRNTVYIGVKLDGTLVNRMPSQVMMTSKEAINIWSSL